MLQPLGITLLDPDAIVIDDVHFIGATRWTDFLLDGLAHEPSAHRAGYNATENPDYNPALCIEL